MYLGVTVCNIVRFLVMDFTTEECLYSIPKLEFFEMWLKYKKDERNMRLFEFILSKFHLQDLPDPTSREIKQIISKYSTIIGEKWVAAGKSKERFINKYSSWFNAGDIKFNICIDQPEPSTSSQSKTSAGRPRIDFEQASFKTKKRRVEDLVQSKSVGELITAAEVATRASGSKNVAKVIRDLSVNPVKANLLSHSKDKSASRQLSGDEALAYYVDSKSTTHSYKQTRKWSMKAGHHVFPSYNCLKKLKNACFPSEEHIFITETRVEINLQGILNKTVERLVESQREVIQSVLPNSSFNLISEWGCDGSSGHSTYKQRFENAEDTDEFLFIFSFVPLRLVDGSTVIWQNPRPSSTMYCRPIKFIFAKETSEFTKNETEKVLEQIKHLLPTSCSFGDSQVTVKHELLLTMIDGKVCNALTETLSSQKCFICGATPRMMNDESRHFDSNRSHYGFGLSTLHAWIRCFECFLHISYKLDIKKWQARSTDEKTSVKLRSENIKQQFKHEMGLIVDKPKPGVGSTNDGNTARRFFGNAEKSAMITGLDVTLLKRFDVLLRTLSSGFEINLIEFDTFCQDTRVLYLNLYSWYYMPATVHKILMHSKEVIEAAIVPIGQLSEGAQEARHKDCRRFRTHNTRKCSRTATNRDLLSMLIITSDPLINSLRDVPKKKTGRFCSEVLKLIVSPQIEIRSPVRDNASGNESDYHVSDSSDDEDDDDDEIYCKD